MAESTPEPQHTPDLQYSAIERLYSEGRWPEVLQASEALLAELPQEQNQPLRPRLQLVIGHTLLYGLADPSGAETRYRSVLGDTDEQVLREIAEQGLSRCDEQRQAVAAPADLASMDPPGSDAADAGSSAAIHQATEAGPSQAAMPWELGGGATPGSAQGAGSGAAMPWLTDLGPTPQAVAAEPVAALPWSGAIESPAPPNPDPLPVEARDGAGPEDPPAPEQPAMAVASADDGADDEADDAADDRTDDARAQPAEAPTPSLPADDTLALLRKPEALIPVTVQVLDGPLESPVAPSAADRGPAAPPPAKGPVPVAPPSGEPPLSPEEIRELARGLLEVVLR